MHSIHNKIEQIKAVSEISDVLLSQLDKHIKKEGERFKIKNKTKLNIKDSWIHKMIEDLSYADWNEVPKFYDPEIILDKIHNLETALKTSDFNELNANQNNLWHTSIHKLYPHWRLDSFKALQRKELLPLSRNSRGG